MTVSFDINNKTGLTVKFPVLKNIKTENLACSQLMICTPYKFQSFKNLNSINTLHTTLRSSEEQNKYNKISEKLNPKDKKTLHKLLKMGILLNDNSNDNSTTLDNLYKIIIEKRIEGLKAEIILSNVISALNNPYLITQKFGDVPNKIANNIILNKEKYEIPQQSKITSKTKDKILPLSKDSLNVDSSSCVAASIQFDLANKMPAEYARIAEGLSSEKMCTYKQLKSTDISLNYVTTLWLLNEFNTEHRYQNWNNIKIAIKPDKNAIIRAKIQTSYKNKNERTPVDVLIQSAIMNLGSQNTYNTLTDIRTGALNTDIRGLTDVEKNLAEVITKGKNKISVVYQILDEDGQIIGYECSHKQTLEHIAKALNLGENVIVGYTHLNEQNRVDSGHEITIVGLEKNKKGKLMFVCNDTDDNKDHSIKYDVDYLLPKIHHAGLPIEVLSENTEIVENWKEILLLYKQLKEKNTFIPLKGV